MKTAVGGRRFCLCLFFFIAGAVFFLAGICLLVLFLPCGLRSLFLFRLRSLLQLHRFRSIFAKLRLSLTGSPGTAGGHFRLCFRLLKNDRFRCCRLLNRSSAILPAAFSRRGSGLCRFGCRFIIFAFLPEGLRPLLAGLGASSSPERIAISSPLRSLLRLGISLARPIALSSARLFQPVLQRTSFLHISVMYKHEISIKEVTRFRTWNICIVCHPSGLCQDNGQKHSKDGILLHIFFRYGA